MRNNHPTKAKPATPLCRSKYQIFPIHPADRRAALKISITEHRVQQPTIWDDQGNLLDGWERERLCQELGTTCPREVRHFDNEADKFRFILSINAHRRPSLSQKQKREVITAYLRGDPTMADNNLSTALGVSKNTVAKIRHRLERARQIPKLQKTRGKDGKLRPVTYTKKIITNSLHEFRKAQEIIKYLPDNFAGKTLDIMTAKRLAARNFTESGSQEWYTPLHCVDAVKAVLEVIELDPASSDEANRTIQALRYFTKRDDALKHVWKAKTVFLNPPYSKGIIDQFVSKLCLHYNCGDIVEAIALVDNATETDWFHVLATCTSAFCFLRSRLAFLPLGGKPANSAPRGQCLCYLGRNCRVFTKVFSKMGLILRK
jgi:hypothetical protein